MDEHMNGSPHKGMGATICFTVSKSAATIIKVDRNNLMIRMDSLYHHEHIIIPNPQGMTAIFSLRKSGRYVMKGLEDKPCSAYLVIGKRIQSINDGKEIVSE
jgi:hypothetical protein